MATKEKFIVTEPAKVPGNRAHSVISRGMSALFYVVSANALVLFVGLWLFGRGLIAPPGWALWWLHSGGRLASMGLLALTVLFLTGVFYLTSAPTTKQFGVGLVCLVVTLFSVAASSWFSPGLIRDQRFDIRGSRVYWCGTLGLNGEGGIVDHLKRARRPGQKLTLVLMGNRGGHVIEAFRMAERLHELGVGAVEVVGRCESACALLWVLAPKRLLAEDSVLGFHAPYGFDGSVNSTARTRQEEAMTRAGFKRSMIDRMMQYGAKEMGYVGAGSQDLEGVDFEPTKRPRGGGGICDSPR